MHKFIFYVYLVWFAIGFLLVGFDWVPDALKWSNSMFLVLAGVVSIQYAVATFGRRKGLIACCVIGAGSFIIEGLSAYFHIFFGTYYYTEEFVPLLFGVPIGIAFAWIAMIMGGHALTTTIRSKVAQVIVAASLAVILDVVLDPVAYIVKQYWIWESDSSFYGIPLSNFIGWTVLALIWQTMLAFMKGQPKQPFIRQTRIVYITIASLFIWLAALATLWKAIVIASVLWGIVWGYMYGQKKIRT